MKPEDLIIRGLGNELSYSASRSSGPGGQNVNKVNTRVELRFNIVLSEVLSDSEKTILISKLGKKITSEGELLMSSQSSRSQLENKKKVTEKFYNLLASVLTPAKKRLATSPSLSSVHKRLEKKKVRSLVKRYRGKPDAGSVD